MSKKTREQKALEKSLKRDAYWHGEDAVSDAPDRAEADGGAAASAPPAQPSKHDRDRLSEDEEARIARQVAFSRAIYQKDHVAAGLFAIFLGIFGVHKFYLGSNEAGFSMLAVTIVGSLFTFGLAAAVMDVISIIEGAIYLSQSQTQFEQTYVLHRRDWF